jgi:hypothetical protein
MSLPQHSILGTLRLLETYIYYDQPSLFSCENQEGQMFIAVWVDRLEEGDTFLYVAVSPERLQSFLEGSIDVRSAFENTESGSIFKVMIPFSNLPAKAISILCEDLDKEDLPEPGIKMQVEK